MHRYFKARIAENRPLHKDYHLLSLLPLDQTKEPQPGQFYMIGAEGDYDPLLKRPFSLLRKRDGALQFLYRIKGRGTMLLRNMGEGAMIDVLGPLGNAYPSPAEGHTPLLVAGGIGIASLFSLLEKLAGSALLFYGARTSSEIFLAGDISREAKEVHIATNDGSSGEKGCVTDTLKAFLAARGSSLGDYTIYACGPRPMFSALWKIVKDRGVTTYVSMEENMACGIGACLGCVVKTVKGHQRVCKEGPVFRIDEIVW